MYMQRRKTLTAIIVCALLAALLCGCAGQGGGTDSPALVTPSTAAPSAAATATPAPEATEAPEDPAPTPALPELPEDVRPLVEAAANTVVVRSAEELVAAIAPDTAILVEPGYYNLSDYLQQVWEESGTDWNRMPGHRYVQLEECYDGVGLVVSGADGLSILGRGAAAETEMVIEPRYADVLRFVDCGGLSIARLTMGHTDTGECVGSVLCFDGCRDVDLYVVDLYGCGVNGICADDTRDLRARDSVIRDCSYGPLDLDGVTGEWLFEDCVLSGSRGGVYIDTSAGADVRFLRCTFGENESNGLFFREDVTTEDCVWSEITQYPDIEPEPNVELTPVRFDAEVLADTVWLGQSMYHFDTQEETMLPLRREGCNIDVVLRLRADGSGALEGLEDEPLLLRWEMAADSDYCADVFLQGEYAESGALELYAVKDAEESPLWLELWLGVLSVRFTYWDAE